MSPARHDRAEPPHTSLAWTVRVAGATFVLDQVSKVVVVWLLGLAERGVMDVLSPWLSFRMAWNEGINFGLFAGGDLTRWVLIAIAVIISGWVAHWMWRSRPSALVQASAGLLIGGALGNALDRVLYGAVADFLNMSCCGIENPYAFNVADIAIFVGALGLILFAGSDKSA